MYIGFYEVYMYIGLYDRDQVCNGEMYLTEWDMFILSINWKLHA